ncbi:MAG: type II toxin-antitoxin system VapC family toxin [Desulfuromusa sp.]|jgi:predicted nucleic acid-binding protein|nr:type II toxin-antitoxin system VapC family toxin [Desulfuromusa sp.]
MNVVIDASAAVGLVLAMPGTESFTPLLEQAAFVAAPDLYVAEVGNAMWKYRKANLLPMARCELALEQIISLPDRFEPSSTLYIEAFALACRHLHPVCDVLYLVLARRTNATILTMDRRLAALAEKLEIQIFIPLAK